MFSDDITYIFNILAARLIKQNAKCKNPPIRDCIPVMKIEACRQCVIDKLQIILRNVPASLEDDYDQKH